MNLVNVSKLIIAATFILPLNAPAQEQQQPQTELGARERIERKIQELQQTVYNIDQEAVKLWAQYAVGYSLIKSMEHTESMIKAVGTRDARRILAVPVEIGAIILAIKGTASAYRAVKSPSIRLAGHTRAWLNEFAEAKQKLAAAQRTFKEAATKADPEVLLKLKGQVEAAEMGMATIKGVRPGTSFMSRLGRLSARPIVLLGGVAAAMYATESVSYIILDENDAKQLSTSLHAWVEELETVLASSGQLPSNS